MARKTTELDDAQAEGIAFLMSQSERAQEQVKQIDARLWRAVGAVFHGLPEGTRLVALEQGSPPKLVVELPEPVPETPQGG